MLNEIIFYILCLICFGLLAWGINGREKIYQYPFFMGVIFTIFILPQAAALVYGSADIPETAIRRVLIMCCFCAAMCWLGYQIPLPKSWFNTPTTNFDKERLRNIALVFVLLGIIFWFLIFTLPSGYGLRLSGESTGIFTIYLFFARPLSNIGFVIALIEACRRRKTIYFLLLTVASIMPIYRAFFFGRRTDIAFIILSLGIALYFTSRYIPPRLFIVSAVLLGVILIPFIGEQRGVLSNKWTNIKDLRPTERLENIVKGESALELRNAALTIDTTANNMNYGFGRLYWNRLVFRYVPAQFLGASLKSSLQFELVDFKDTIYEVYDYGIPTGTTTTGIGDTFTQFDYLGCLFFALISIIFKWFWYRASLQNDQVAQLIYMNISIYGMLSVTHNSADFIPNLVSMFIFIKPVVMLSRIKQRIYQVG